MTLLRLLTDAIRRAIGAPVARADGQGPRKREAQLSEQIVALIEAEVATRCAIERMAARMTIIDTAAGACLAKTANELDPGNRERCICTTATEAMLPAIIRSAFFHAGLSSPEVRVVPDAENHDTPARTLQ